MAYMLDSEALLCFMWTFEKPHFHRSQRSDLFKLQGFEWYLEVKSSSSLFNAVWDSISLKRNSEAKSIETHFYVTTYLFRDPTFTSACSRFGCTRKITNPCTVLWNFNTNDRSFAEHRTFGDWRVFCLFHDVPSSTYQVKHAISDKMIQTDEPVPLSLTEKSALACLGAPYKGKFSCEFYDLSKFERDPDATLLCEGRIFEIHTDILSARSDKFKNIFRKIAETKKNIYGITDLKAHILGLILQWIYKVEISDVLSSETAVELYKGAHEYAMSSLQKTCSEWMMANLAVNNCVSFLYVVNIDDDMLLKTALANFICSNPTVLKTADWIKFSKNELQLANEIHQQFVMSLNLDVYCRI